MVKIFMTATFDIFNQKKDILALKLISQSGKSCWWKSNDILVVVLKEVKYINEKYHRNWLKIEIMLSVIRFLDEQRLKPNHELNIHSNLFDRNYEELISMFQVSRRRKFIFNFCPNLFLSLFLHLTHFQSLITIRLVS